MIFYSDDVKLQHPNVISLFYRSEFPDTHLDDYERCVANLETFNDSYDTNTTNGSLPNIHQCLKSGKCANENEKNISGNCAEGYTGWVCTACETHYFPILGVCGKCPKPLWLMLDVLYIVIVIVILIFLFLIIRSHQGQGSRSRSLVDSTLALGKIVLGFYQVMGEFWESIDVIFWPTFFKKLSEWLDLLQFNIASKIVKPSCIAPSLVLTPYTAFIFGAIFPYFAMACSALASSSGNNLEEMSERC